MAYALLCAPSLPFLQGRQMIARNAEAISHRTPLPRIDLNPVRKAPADGADAGFSYSPAECTRIWDLLRKTAEGCTCPTSPQSSPDLPTDSGDIVCTAGWEAA
jgi:hypothetical protein